MFFYPASGQSADTVLGRTSSVESPSAGQARGASLIPAEDSGPGFVPPRSSASLLDGSDLLAGLSVTPVPPTGPERHDIRLLMDELGLDWHGATIAWCARRLPALAEASAEDLSTAASTILDAARRFSTVADIRLWYEANPVFCTVRRAVEQTSASEVPLATEAAQWSADAWTSYDLTDAAFDRDRKIHLALHDWPGAASLPLLGVFSSLSAVADFAVESSTRAYCYGIMSGEDLRTVRSFQPLLEGVPESVVVKRAVLDGQPPVVAILLTHQELIARPRASVIDTVLARNTDEGSPEGRAIKTRVDRMIHEGLVARLREEAAKRLGQRAWEA
jgi:hypothetical protein